jgi:CubicO group peptidase (beta-lactamase class C family)
MGSDRRDPRILRRAVAALLCAASCLSATGAPELSTLQENQLAVHVRPGYPFATPSRWTPMRAAGPVLELGEAAAPAALEWVLDGATHTIDRYFERQPVTALLVAKNGKLVFERYQYSGNHQALFLSNSMAKSFTGLAIALLEAAGQIESLDDPAERYVPTLKGSRSGQTSLRNHLRMGSGMRYRETYRPGDDHSKFVAAVDAVGSVQALRSLTEQEHPPGSVFQYAGHSSTALSTVVQAVAGMNQARYLEVALWQKLGSEGTAYWREDQQGASLGYCCLLARARDYLRLGVVLAHGGRRPDTGEQIVPTALMQRLTKVQALDAPFRPPQSGALGYDSQFWISGQVEEAFMLVGIYGQMMAVYPRSRLVILHLAVNTSPVMAETTMARERPALFSAIWRRYR